MCPVLFQELRAWQGRQTVIHSYQGQRRKILDEALQARKAQRTRIPQATVRSWEVILSAVRASGRY